MAVRPPLAVSLGDPAGIGPELAVKAFLAAPSGIPCFCVVGNPVALEAAAAAMAKSLPIAVIAAPSQAVAVWPQALPVVAVGDRQRPTFGRPQSRFAPEIIAAVEMATDFVVRGQASALVTLPISKALLYDAGFRFPGHTEFVAALVEAAPYQGPRGPVMMLAGPSLRVALATIHLPLAAVPGALDPHALETTVRVTDAALRRDFGVGVPRIAVAGLNPHAGENGALGQEERAIIIPVTQALRAAGLQVEDPSPADTLFHAEARARYDAVIAMYHDQGLIPLKTLHFWDAVNVTLGLPIVRTSPDHGAAYDIAGTGRARVDSVLAALRLAAEIADRRAAST